MSRRTCGWTFARSGRVHELQGRTIRGDEEDAAVPAGVRPHRLEDGLQGPVQGGGEEVLALFQVAKAIDDQRPAGAQHAPDGGEGFARQQMRGGGVAQERVEDDGVILLAAAVQEMASVVQRQVELVGLQVEEANGHRHHGGVDFHHVHARALAGELHRHDAHAQADAEHVVDVGGVGPRQSRERVGEMGDALLPLRIVGVLDQAVVQVETAAAVAPVNDLEQAEVGVAPE